MTTDNDPPEVKGFVGRIRNLLKGIPRELDNRSPAALPAYLLDIACLACCIGGAWLAVMNSNLYVHPRLPGYLVWSGVFAGILSMGLAGYVTATYRQQRMVEIVIWCGFLAGFIDMVSLLGPDKVLGSL